MLKQIGFSALSFIKAHKAQILIGAGIVGNAAATVIACKQTFTASSIIENHKFRRAEVEEAKNICRREIEVFDVAAGNDQNGKVYTGCNVENHGIQSICGERTAFVKALSEGEREFESITIVGANKGEEPTEKCMPCGYCRQFMSEFVDDDFKICVVNNGEVEEYTINDLLPNRFDF